MNKLLTTAALALLATPAFAHHPLNGMPMETFTHGILSGIGHPVLGFDHLFFVALVGIAAAFTGRIALAPLGYIAGMLAGLAMILGGIALPGVEVVIAMSLLVMGAIVLSGRKLPIGTAVIQYLIAVLAAVVIRAITDDEAPIAIQPRLAGAMVAGIGLFLVMEAAEGPFLSAIGLG